MSNTSNTIQIKRGINPPGENALFPYELGYTVNRYLKDSVLVENSSGGYLYIGDLKSDDATKTLPVKIKAGYADTAGTAGTANIANALSETLSINKGGTGVTTHLGIRQLLYGGEIQSDTIQQWAAKGISVFHSSQTGASIAQPSDYGFILNLTTAHETAADVAQLWLSLPDGAVYRRQGFVNWSQNGEWTPLLDKYNLTIPLADGSLNYGNVNSNETCWAINLKSSYGLALNGNSPSATNPPSNWGIGVKFHVNATAEERWSGIIGYAHEIWANETGLKFITKSSAGDTRTATFAAGTFTTPKLATKSIVKSTDEGLSIEATDLTAFDFNAVMGVITALNVEGLTISDKMVLGSKLYGNTDPNTANISGVEGQLYFQVVSG